MPVVNRTNLVRPHRWRAYLSFLSETIVFSRDVNMSSITYPLTALTFDGTGVGSTGDVLEGMEVRITRAGDEVGRLRVAPGGASGSTLQVNEFAQGRLALADNDRIEVLRSWRLRDRLVAASDTFDKDSRVAYTDQFENPAPWPNVGAGGAWVGWKAYSNAIPFAGSGSIVLDPDSAGTMTYAWTFPSATPSSSSSDFVSVDYSGAAAGTYWGTFTVTDSSNSKSATKYIPIRIHDDSDPPVDVVEMTISADEVSWRASITVRDTLSLSELPDGAAIWLWAFEHYGASIYSDRGNRPQILFSGYLLRDTVRHDPDAETLTFEAVGARALLERLPGFSAVLTSATSPANWQEMKGLTVNRAIAGLLRWHTTAAETLELSLPTTSYTYPELFIQQQTPGAQIQELADAVDCVFASNRLGNLRVYKPLYYADSTARGIAVTSMTLQTDDMRSAQIEREHRIEVGQLEGRGFLSTAGVPVFSRAPGLAPDEGAQQQTVDRLIVSTQTELNQRTGRRFARLNRTYNRLPAARVQLELRPGLNVFDPAHNDEWTAFTGLTTKRGITYTNQRCTINTVSTTYQPNNKLVSLELQCETDGPSAATYVPPDTNVPPITDVNLVPISNENNWGLNPFPLWSGTDQVPLTILAVEAKGNGVARGTGISGGSTTWTDIETSTITGNGRWASSDPYDYQRFFVLTTDGIFRTNNKLAPTPTWSQSATGADIFGASGRYGHLLLMSHNLKGWMLVPSGTYVAVTFDYGATWTRTDLYGGTGAYMTNPDYIQPMAMRVVIGNHNSATHGELWAVLPYDAPFDNGAPTLFKSEDWGLTWSVALQLDGEGALYQGTSLYAPYRRDATTANTSGNGHKLYWMGGTIDGFSGSSFHRTVVTSGGTEAFDETLPYAPIGPPNPWAFQFGGNGPNAYMNIPSHLRNYHVHPSNGDLVTTIVSDVDYSIGSGEVALALSSDGGATWTISNKLTGLAGFPNLNGFSMHRRFFIVWKGWTSATYLPTGYYYSLGAGYLKVTADNGDTWFGNSPPSFTDGAVAYAEADLSAFQ